MASRDARGAPAERADCRRGADHLLQKNERFLCTVPTGAPAAASEVGFDGMSRAMNVDHRAALAVAP
jgi:hypothetical protein